MAGVPEGLWIRVCRGRRGTQTGCARLPSRCTAGGQRHQLCAHAWCVFDYFLLLIHVYSPHRRITDELI
eukprot:scaffold24481_cov125-Isochrysis_galbana.AAC.1